MLSFSRDARGCREKGDWLTLEYRCRNFKGTDLMTFYIIFTLVRMKTAGFAAKTGC